MNNKRLVFKDDMGSDIDLIVNFQDDGDIVMSMLDRKSNRCLSVEFCHSGTMYPFLAENLRAAFSSAVRVN